MNAKMVRSYGARLLIVVAALAGMACGRQEHSTGSAKSGVASSQPEYAGVDDASGDRMYVVKDTIDGVFAFRDRCRELCKGEDTFLVWNDNENHICRCPDQGKRYLLKMMESERMTMSEKEFREAIRKSIRERTRPAN
ncbi:MAG: hypothetical protein KJ634_00505 [Gammaproteobacteria bacterium]|nr:hypothetical protein [Gammaproteobacteria bacterium]MBU1414080.1 hypothetical protein [Gammaproteobacteria bacterium]